MKRRRFLRLGAGGAVGAALSGTVLAGCDSFLEPDVHSQLTPSSINSVAGFEAVLGAAYSGIALIGGTANRIWTCSECTTDVLWETSGGFNRLAKPFINFTWNASTVVVGQMWRPRWRGIRDANVVLDALETTDLSEEKQTNLRAEAHFIRAVGYFTLYEWFGPVPLRVTTDTNEQPLNIPRASEDEMRGFIETELQEALQSLPEPGQEPNAGRANTGAARSYLAKFYLQTKQWQKAADMAQEVIDMNAYRLYPNYLDMFKEVNETNDEYIWTWGATIQGPGNFHMNGAFPPSFRSHPRTGLEWRNNWTNWARQDRMLDGFYFSFDSKDERRKPIVEEYVNADDELIQLAGNDNARSFKYWPDPNANGALHGNDYPALRYADILLTRAEALNEVRGPNPESISLVNQVRSRAGLSDIVLGDFGSKKALREHIVVKERGWSFYTERKRRNDLIRVGKFIDFARNRGLTAEPYRRLFPIPQFAIDANPELEQNPGYGGAS